MGLLLGGSVLTMFELLDLIAFHFLKNLLHPLLPEEDPEKGKEKDNMTDSETERKRSPLDSGFNNSLAATPDREKSNGNKISGGFGAMDVT